MREEYEKWKAEREATGWSVVVTPLPNTSASNFSFVDPNANWLLRLWQRWKVGRQRRRINQSLQRDFAKFVDESRRVKEEYERTST